MAQWAALATGAQAGIDQYLKRLIAEREMVVAEKNAAANDEYRKGLIETNRINAESLKQQRETAAQEKETKMAARRQRDEWAKTTLAAGMPQVTNDQDPAQRVALLNYYRAKHWAEAGEELPDAVVTNLLTPRPVREDPNLLSADAERQKLRIIAAQNAGRARATGAAQKAAAEKRAANAAVSNYLSEIQARNPKLEDALRVWNMPGVQQDFLRKAGGYYTLPQLRAMLGAVYKDPQTLQQYMDAIALNSMRGAGQSARDEDPETDYPE